jgi:hypothetical protein
VVGDLIIVKRAEKLAPDQPVDPANPLISKDRMLLYPEFDAGVNRGLQPDVNFVVPMVLTPGGTPPEASLGLLTAKGETLASVSLPLGKAEESGGCSRSAARCREDPAGKHWLQIDQPVTTRRIEPRLGLWSTRSVVHRSMVHKSMGHRLEALTTQRTWRISWLWVLPSPVGNVPR